MQNQLERLAKLHANLLLSIEEDVEDLLWERNSLWTSAVKDVFDHVQKMWTQLLGDIVKKSFKERKNFSKSDEEEIIIWRERLDEDEDENHNNFWDKFVSDNKKLLDKVIAELFEVGESISFYCSSNHIKYRNAAKYLHNEISGKQDQENKKTALEDFLKNPDLILERELETVVLFYEKIVTQDGKDEQQIKELYRDKVKTFKSGKDQLAKNYRRKQVERMLKQLDWQKYCGAERRIEKAMNIVTNQRVLTLYGIGGLGKTALATEIVRRYFAEDAYDYFPFITSKSTEQGHYTFSERISKSDPTDPKIHPGNVNTNDFDVLINTLLEIDETRSQIEKNQLTLEEKKNIVFELFRGEKILCVIDNYEDIERNPEQREKYAELIDFLMENDTQSRIIITARETDSGVKLPVEYLDSGEIKNLLEERIKWHTAKEQEIVNIPEYLRVINEKIDKLKDKEFEIWGHPYIVLYLAWMISNKEDPHLLVERIINDEDEIVLNIATYCVDKTLEHLHSDVREYIGYVSKLDEAEFTRKEMEDWFLDFKNKQLATEEREEFIRQLKGGTHVTEKMDYDDISVFTVTQLTRTRLNPSREISNFDKDKMKNQSSGRTIENQEWIDELEEYVNDPLANSYFYSITEWKKQFTDKKDIAKIVDPQYKTELQDENVARTKRLINQLRNNDNISLDNGFLEKDIMIRLMEYENNETTRMIDIVDNILQLFTFKYLEDDIKEEFSEAWLIFLDDRHKKRKLTITFSQETTHKIVNTLELIYEINSWNHESNINSSRDLTIMKTWFDWLYYVSIQDDFLFLPDQDVVYRKASIVAYLLQKHSPNVKYEQWLNKSLQRLSDNELKNLIRNVIIRQTYSFEQLKSEIINNKRILPYTQAYVKIDEQPSVNKYNQLSCKLIFKRNETDTNCALNINGFYNNDVINYQHLYLVKFENTEFLSSINCTIARDDEGNLIFMEEYKLPDTLTKKESRIFLTNLFLEKIKPEGTLHELVFQVSIAEEITSSPRKFSEIKKAAGFGKKTKPAVFVKELLGDDFTAIAGIVNDRPRYTYSGDVKYKSSMQAKKQTTITNKGTIKSRLDEIIQSEKLDPSDVRLPVKNEMKILFDFLEWFAHWFEEFSKQCEPGIFDSEIWQKMKNTELDKLDLNSKKRNSINFTLKKLAIEYIENHSSTHLGVNEFISVFKDLYITRLNNHYPARNMDVKMMVSKLFSDIK